MHYNTQSDLKINVYECVHYVHVNMCVNLFTYIYFLTQALKDPKDHTTPVAMSIPVWMGVSKFSTQGNQI